MAGPVAERPDSSALPSGSPEPHDAETLGQALRRARQQRGLTVQQIAATTRIPARHFEALERDDLGALPGGMYRRAEVRAYADAVGLSRSTALAYLEKVDPPVAPNSPAHGTATSVERRPSNLIVVIASLGLVIAAVVMWGPSRELRPAPAAPPPPSRPSTNDSPLPVTADVAAATATSGVNGPGSGVPSDSALAVAEHPPAPPVAEPELEIVTTPPGAHVTIDGVGWGVTPVAIRYLPPGAKRLRVTRDGYAAEQRVIRILADQPKTTVRVELHQLE